MKKHKVIFLDGPVAGQEALLDPHETKILVIYREDGYKLLAVIRREEGIDIAVTDHTVVPITYVISELKGEERLWYVATRRAGDRDHVLAILVGSLLGEGYTSGALAATKEKSNGLS